MNSSLICRTYLVGSIINKDLFNEAVKYYKLILNEEKRNPSYDDIRVKIERNQLNWKKSYCNTRCFRWDYISKNQLFFIYLKEQNLYVKKLIPSPGFCERSEIFTGLKPEKSGNFLAYGLKKYYQKIIVKFFKILFDWVLIKRLFYFNIQYKKNN